LTARCIGRGRQRADERIHPQFVPMCHVGRNQVADFARHGMPCDRSTDTTSHSNCKSGRVSTVDWSGVDHKEGRTSPASPGYRGNLTAACESSDSGQHGRSDADRGATLAPTCRKDGSTGTGAHSQTESVLAVPTSVVRLICALAHYLTPRFSVAPLDFFWGIRRAVRRMWSQRFVVIVRQPVVDKHLRSNLRPRTTTGRTG